jgi:hypothetical protein
MFYQTSEGGQRVHLENPQKTVSLSPQLVVEFWVQVTQESSIAWMHILTWFGSDGPMTSPVTFLLGVSSPCPYSDKGVPKHTPFCSFCALVFFLWNPSSTHFSEVQTTLYYFYSVHYTACPYLSYQFGLLYPPDSQPHLLQFSVGGLVFSSLSSCKMSVRISEPMGKEPYVTNSFHHTQEVCLCEYLWQNILLFTKYEPDHVDLRGGNLANSTGGFKINHGY